MEKYTSELVKAKDITIHTSKDRDGLFLVVVRHNPSKIEVDEESDIGQIDAYNKCIKSIEWIMHFKKFKEEYKNKPDLFMEKFLGIKLLPHQRWLLRNINKIDIKKSFMTRRR